jgi:hypothetical protein
MRIGLGVAAMALVLVGACGGNDGANESGAATPPSSAPTLDLLSAEQACTQVGLVIDELGGKPGDWPVATYGEFGEKVAPLADESVPDVTAALKATSAKAIEVGGMNLDAKGGIDAATQAAGEWASTYKKVVDICMRTDAPLTPIRY